MAQLKTAQDALSLPEGQLNIEAWINVLGAAFDDNMVLEAAQLIVDADDSTEFLSQAAVIAHAGNTYSWGLGSGYSSYSPVPEGLEQLESTSLADPMDALKLKEGRLLINMGIHVEASFGSENALACAELIIAANDSTVFTSQAEVIAHAGNNYEWGKGGGYTAV